MNQYRIYAFREDGHFSTENVSNVRTGIRQSNKHSKFWTARMVNSGRVNTLSHLCARTPTLSHVHVE